MLGVCLLYTGKFCLFCLYVIMVLCMAALLETLFGKIGAMCVLGVGILIGLKLACDLR